jgi:hypothetical protein
VASDDLYRGAHFEKHHCCLQKVTADSANLNVLHPEPMMCLAEMKRSNAREMIGRRSYEVKPIMLIKGRAQ